ncbi:hypothetical protein [Cesiribacter andamanensis]|uniref:Outer membrane protein n=1 Tax=Cesiribacter andamanensis AMV16 TaxID=1279009 RepID=M7N9F2_9BACT|nr:hypothetical protein [Cesiribacter andamanensis]EMR03816.1 hypothetical protein ADICEAN_01059 [Cesiribacter andamanensis AMV16]
MKPSSSRTAAALWLWLFCFSSAFAQQQPGLYSKPASPLLKELPALPASSAAAYSLATATATAGEPHQQKMVPSESFATRKKSLERIIEEMQASSLVLSASAGSTTAEQEQLMKQLQDPAFQKKLEAMSQQEQMAFAMKMQQVMTAGGGQLNGAEEEDVSEVLNTMGDISFQLNGTQLEPSSYSGLQQKIAALYQNVRQHNTQVWEWEQAEYKKIPLVASHLRQQVVSNKEPKLVKELRLAAQAKRIAHMDQQLKALAPHWNAHLAYLQQTLTTVDQQLAGINYYSRFKNNVFKNQLAAYHVTSLQQIQYLWEDLEKIILESAELQLALNKLEKTPVESFD